MIKIREHICGLRKSTLLVRALLVSQTQAADSIHNIDLELAVRVVGGLKTRNRKFCRSQGSNNSTDDLEGVAQELRRAIDSLNKVLRDAINKFNRLKSNTEQFGQVIVGIRASLTTVLENEESIERIIWFYGLS